MTSECEANSQFVGPSPHWALYFWIPSPPIRILYCHRPCGKESTKVRITHNKGKEREKTLTKN